jgi:uncharacterized protein (TIGR00251 family)
LIEHSVKDGKLTFRVQVVTRASRSEVVGEHNGALRVRIAASPVEGAANAELIRTLAKAFEVPTGAVEIIRGQTSRLKTVSVTGPRKQIF